MKLYVGTRKGLFVLEGEPEMRSQRIEGLESDQPAENDRLAQLGVQGRVWRNRDRGRGEGSAQA